MRRLSRNAMTGALLSGDIAAMVGLSAAAVPLYDLFCRTTGYGGTPRTAASASETLAAVEVRVAFNADIDPGMPWGFRPLQREMTVRPGEEHLAFYEAVNRSDRPVMGRAVYNVTPVKVGGYFAKLECFCFQEQLLEPGERVEMPVSFFVDPAMLDDESTREVRQITLSYTFYMDVAATAELARRRSAGETG